MTGRGYLFAVASSIGLGLAVAASRAAWEGGTTPLSVASVRAVALVLLLWALCRASGRSLRLPRRDLLGCLGLGVLAAQMFYGNIGAVETIPVGLAALCFLSIPRWWRARGGAGAPAPVRRGHGRARAGLRRRRGWRSASASRGSTRRACCWA